MSSIVSDARLFLVHNIRRLSVLFVSAAFLLAGCGVEGSYVPGKPAKTKSEKKLEADKSQPPLIDNLRKFAVCMREKGLAYPDPGPQEDQAAGEYIRRNARPGEAAFEAANDACRIVVFGEPTGGPGGERGPEGGDDPS